MFKYTTQTKPSNVVLIELDDNTTCTVNLHGCTITSWRVKNWEQLFVSRHAKYDHRKQILGGIAIDFPKVAKWEFGPDNGFARISEWKLVDDPYLLKNGKVRAVFQLVDNPHTRSFWNFNFSITLTITLGETTLELDVKIMNTSPVLPFRFNLMFPISMEVRDVTSIHINGLQNVQYFDETVQDKEVYTDRRKTLDIDNWINRIYKDAPNNLEVDRLAFGNKIKITKRLLDDVLVWNPWLKHAAEVDDFRPEQYKEMIFVGLGNVTKECRLAPGEFFETSFKLELWKEPAFSLALY